VRTPWGASSGSGRKSLTTTLRLVKCSVSSATARTSTARVGSHPSPKRSVWAPEEDGDKFRLFIHRILETPGQHGDIDPAETLLGYLTEKIRDRREAGARVDDLVSYLLEVTDDDGNRLSDEHIFGTIALLLIAGIDTTWSAIGASLWHFAQHPDDRRRWLEDEDVHLFAIEELLRFHAPVTMARLAGDDAEIGGCPIPAEDWVLLPFPAYNRDPEAFERADEFVIDRARNRHSAFGLGIHRCLGSNLARMELTVAIEEWMQRFREFAIEVVDS